MYLVGRGHFQSRDKDDGRIIRSAVTENPMLHANCSAVCFIGPKLLPIEVLHCRNRDFRPFCSCDLDLDPMTFIYKLEPYSFEIYRMCKSELPTSKLSEVIVRQTDRQTDRQAYRHDRNHIRRRFASSQ